VRVPRGGGLPETEKARRARRERARQDAAYFLKQAEEARRAGRREEARYYRAWAAGCLDQTEGDGRPGC
jgi:hypothetical protein